MLLGARGQGGAAPPVGDRVCLGEVSVGDGVLSPACLVLLGVRSPDAGGRRVVPGLPLLFLVAVHLGAFSQAWAPQALKQVDEPPSAQGVDHTAGPDT